jgi:hypothetical protein
MSAARVRARAIPVMNIAGENLGGGDVSLYETADAPY